MVLKQIDIHEARLVFLAIVLGDGGRHAGDSVGSTPGMVLKVEYR